MSEKSVAAIIAQTQKAGTTSSKVVFTPSEVLALLQAEGADAELLYRAADDLRQKYHGQAVFLRGIIEFSNICTKNCYYCGIRQERVELNRYRMSPGEICEQAKLAKKWGCSTVVLQSGEDPWFTVEILSDLVRAIKETAEVAVTLSVGERTREEYAKLWSAGVDRYLLRFETSDRELFKAIHPDDDYDERQQCIRDLRELGYQVGSGFLIGLPPGDLSIIVKDLLFATGLDLDMIGCGPFIPTPGTPLEQAHLLVDQEIYYKAIAILRLLNPLSHIPATTAFDTLEGGGRDRLLRIGANVFMPNITPQKYRTLYQLYPNKPCVDQDGLECLNCATNRLSRLGRHIGQGPGHSLKFRDTH